MRFDDKPKHIYYEKEITFLPESCLQCRRKHCRIASRRGLGLLKQRFTHERPENCPLHECDYDIEYLKNFVAATKKISDEEYIEKIEKTIKECQNNEQ